MKNIKGEIDTLTRDVRKHQRLYYVEHNPQISDREFDELFQRLVELEAKHPELADKNSPTRIVGSDLDNTFEKFTHKYPVVSLSNTYSVEEAVKWLSGNTYGNDLVNVQWKIDGATLVLYYEKGILKKAVTRGSGQVGDDVTYNALTIRNIPHVLDGEYNVVARGEVYMTFSDFEKFNAANDNVYANPRNLAAGSIKHKRSIEAAKRPLRWAAFDVIVEGQAWNSDTNILQAAELMGLPIVEGETIPAHDFKNKVKEYEERRKKTDFPIDGLVIKIDDMAQRQKLGFTSHHPRWAVALKFETEFAETVVEDVEFFPGRTGRVTPRARLQPVQLGGSTVSYATLHNADYIEKLDVRIGARVKVSKRGEIIPAVEEVVDKGTGGKLKFPKDCPACQSPLKREEGEVDYKCANKYCESKVLNRLIFFAQRKQMDIAGLGERVCAILLENDLIKDVADLYELHTKQEQMKEIEKFGERSIELLLHGIEESKKQPFQKVLPSLGLKELGHKNTELLIESGYDNIDSMIALAVCKNANEILTEIDGIGEKSANEIVKQLTDPENKQLIKRLKASGLQFEQSKVKDENYEPIFADQVWCITGSFQNYKPREKAGEEIKKRGGKITSSISSSTTHLLAGEKAGSKIKKAEDLGVKVINEQEFTDML